MWAWLGKVESMGRSFSAYAPVALLAKGVDYARVFLLTWLIGTEQFGIWGLGGMVFGLASTASTLGTNQSVARYVSFYQARGQLRSFFRRAGLSILLVGLIVTGAGALASGHIADLLAVSKTAHKALVLDARIQIVLLGLLNGLLLALYQNLHSCIRAMRTFHLLAVLEAGFTVLFTAAALVGAKAAPAGQTGIAILWAHAGALLVMLLAGGFAAHRCLRVLELAQAEPVEADAIGEPGDVMPQDDHVGPDEHTLTEGGGSTLHRLLRFGFLAMVATLTWQVGNFLSRWMTNRFHGPAEAGIYSAMQTFCQPAWVFSGIIWGLVFSHLASHWESNNRHAAVRMVNLTYKAVVLVLMSGTVIVLVTGPWWGLLLGERYRDGLTLLAGLLMFYQCSANLGLASMVAKLREKPIVIAVIIVIGVGVNAVLGRMWIPGAENGALAAARAAGIGMLVAVALGTVYLVGTGFRVHPATHLLAFSPALLLAPPVYVACAWVAVLVVAAFTPLVFTAREKRLLGGYVLSMGMRRRRGRR